MLYAPAQVASKLSSARSALSSSATAQVEAMRYGMQLLDKSHRYKHRALTVEHLAEGAATTAVAIAVTEAVEQQEL